MWDQGFLLCERLGKLLQLLSLCCRIADDRTGPSNWPGYTELPKDARLVLENAVVARECQEFRKKRKLLDLPCAVLRAILDPVATNFVDNRY